MGQRTSSEGEEACEAGMNRTGFLFNVPFFSMRNLMDVN